MNRPLALLAAVTLLMMADPSETSDTRLGAPPKTPLDAPSDTPSNGPPESQEAEDDALRVVCTEPRPQMCTREYAPVCGERPGMQSRSYGNGCTACADPAVVAYRPGACT